MTILITYMYIFYYQFNNIIKHYFTESIPKSKKTFIFNYVTINKKIFQKNKIKPY